MKRNPVYRSAKDAVCFLILIHLTTSVFSFECPKNIANNCSCQTVPEYSSSCSKNNEKISINSKSENEPEWNVKVFLEFNCTNDSNEEIYDLLNFEFPNNFNETGIGLKVNSCPTSVAPLIWRSILGYKDFQNILIRTSNLATLPTNILQNQTNLLTLQIIGNNLTSLPESILNNQTDIQFLQINETDLTTLPESIFSQQKKLNSLNLGENKLTTLPETIFNSQTKLKGLWLNGNFVVILL